MLGEELGLAEGDVLGEALGLDEGIPLVSKTST
jgi:hypothetical protein